METEGVAPPGGAIQASSFATGGLGALPAFARAEAGDGLMVSMALCGRRDRLGCLLARTACSTSARQLHGGETVSGAFRAAVGQVRDLCRGGGVDEGVSLLLALARDGHVQAQWSGCLSMVRVRGGTLQALTGPPEQCRRDMPASPAASFAKWGLEQGDRLVAMSGNLVASLSRPLLRCPGPIGRLDAHECCARLLREALGGRVDHAALVVADVLGSPGRHML